MQDIGRLNDFLKRVRTNTIMNIIEVQQKTANEISEDAKTFAPVGTGKYKESIKVSETKVEENHISTYIYTDALVQAKFNGNIYNLGYLLENGTLEHAIPNAWGRGYTYGYIDRYGYRHKGTMDKDWHPGFKPFPHFIPALLLNKEKYNIALQKAIDKEFK